MKKRLYIIGMVLCMSMTLQGGGKIVKVAENPPAQIESDKWSGSYIGVEAGYITTKGDTALHTQLNLNSPAGAVANKKDYTLELKPKGAIGGIYLGYNKLLQNSYVVGAELALNYTNIKKSQKVDTDLDFMLKQKGDIALYAKAGKVLGADQNLLAYLLAGVSSTTLEGALTVLRTTMWNNDTVLGTTLGAGVEYRISKSWNMRLQYRFSIYSDAKLDYYNTTPDGVEVYNIKVKNHKTHSIMLGISRHF